MIDVIILAGGRGTRMKSKTPKVLQTIAEKSMIRYIIDEFKGYKGLGNIHVITSPDIDGSPVFQDIRTVVQQNPLGSGDACSRALPHIESEYVIITCGDMPLLQMSDLEDLICSKAEAVILSTKLPAQKNHMPYGRVIIEDGNFQKIVEYKDANDLERSCDLINTGIYKIRTNLLKKYIGLIDNNNKSNEYYLTDIFSILKKNNIKIDVAISNNYEAFHGINTMEDLSYAEFIIQDRLRSKFMRNGVKLLDPKSTYFSYDTEIESSVIVEQNNVFKKGVSIKSGSIIHSFCYLENCKIEENVEIGPFARIRGNSHFKEGSRIGNFVEVKGSTFCENSKSKHLTYIGDATVGQNTNIGAGTITCNYDGFRKHKTEIGDNVFVGSNTTLIAPLTIGYGSLIAAGSVITQDIGNEELAISRVVQNNIKDGAKKVWNRKKGN